MRPSGPATGRRAALSLAFLLLPLALARALDIPPKPLGRVSDYALLLNAADRDRLESRLAGIEQASGNQFAVVIFRSLEGEDLESFSIRLAEAWKIGRKGVDNGVVILVFPDDRKMRIEVGYGLEGNIPDITAGRVIREVMAPRFRQNDYAGGLLAAVDALDAAARGQKLPEPQAPAAPENRWVFWVLIVIIGLVFLESFMQIYRNRHHVIGGRRGRSSDSWHSGGYGGGFFGSGSSGGGGFSGGGGSFGGGGASGSW